ncbi:MAG: hypothetical protein ACREX8_11765 [Gammaproteobacteria bacterium]
MDDLYVEFRRKAMDHLVSISMPPAEAERAQTTLGAGHAWAMLALAEAIRLDTLNRENTV